MSDDKDALDSPWGKIVFGLIIAGLAFGLNTLLAQVEAGTSMRTHWIIVLLYTTLGRKATVGVLLAAGAGCFLLGVRQLLSDRK